MSDNRLNLYLTRVGACRSRRLADNLISAGRVSINGQQVSRLATRVGLDDRVTVDGTEVTRRPPLVYWLLHKPRAYLVSHQDKKPTIFDLPKLKHLPFPLTYVGRLDFNSEGLLLLTNDGKLTHKLCHPRFKVRKTYHVLLSRKLSPEEHRLTERGELLDDGKVDYFQLRYLRRQFLGKSYGYLYRVVVAEGRNRLLRRVFATFAIRVLRLRRVAYGELYLPDDLPTGHYRQLSSAQISYLKNSI